MFALLYLLVCIILLTFSQRKDDLISRSIKYLRVDHQIFDESVPEESLSANFSLIDCFASRIKFTTGLRIVLIFYQFLFGLWCNVPVNSYCHVKTVC